MIWKVPEDYTVMEPYEDVHPIAELKGHSRYVVHCIRVLVTDFFV